jgi:acetolactate synthase-1/2/3 large subunit
MTGGEAIVAELLRHSVDVVFGLPGAQIYGLFDALHAESKRIRVVGARHEHCVYRKPAHRWRAAQAWL